MTTAVDEQTAAVADEALETEAEVSTEIVAGGDEQAEGQTDEADGELVVSIGEEAPPQDEFTAAPTWVRDLRKQNRELSKRAKELEQRLAEKEQPQQTALPAKPTLEACDYDADAYERQLTQWFDAKRAHDDAEAQQRKAQEQAEAAWQAKLQAYEASKAKLGAADVDDVEHVVRQMFNETQWAILVDGADNAALLTYALGKNPAKAKELASVASLSQFAFKAAKIEAEIKTMKRTAKPAPEGAITGTSPGAIGGADATLERLRAEALKTGDMTKVVAYRRQLRAAS
jgi:hypothetical protein